MKYINNDLLINKHSLQKFKIKKIISTNKIIINPFDSEKEIISSEMDLNNNFKIYNKVQFKKIKHPLKTIEKNPI